MNIKYEPKLQTLHDRHLREQNSWNMNFKTKRLIAKILRRKWPLKSETYRLGFHARPLPRKVNGHLVHTTQIGQLPSELRPLRKIPDSCFARSRKATSWSHLGRSGLWFGSRSSRSFSESKYCSRLSQ